MSVRPWPRPLTGDLSEEVASLDDLLIWLEAWEFQLLRKLPALDLQRQADRETLQFRFTLGRPGGPARDQLPPREQLRLDVLTVNRELHRQLSAASIDAWKAAALALEHGRRLMHFLGPDITAAERQLRARLARRCRDDQNVHADRDREIAARYLEIMEDWESPDALRILGGEFQLGAKRIRVILKEMGIYRPARLRNSPQ